MGIRRRIHILLGREKHDFKYIEGVSWWRDKGPTHICTKCGAEHYCSPMQLRALLHDYPEYSRGCKGGAHNATK